VSRSRRPQQRRTSRGVTLRQSSARTSTTSIAIRWQSAWRRGAWTLLNEHQRLRRTRPLAERLKGLLLSWPLRSDSRLPYATPQVHDWPRCEQRERQLGDGEYYVRHRELLRVLVKLLEPARQALRQRRIPDSLDQLADLVTRAAGAGIRVTVVDICSIVERGRDAAWRDRQRVRGARLLRETAKAQARFDRWVQEAKWVLAQRDRLELSPALVAALGAETRPRSWAGVRLPLRGYIGRPSAGGESRSWEQKVGYALRQLGMSRDDADTIRRSCGLMERSHRRRSSC
jgi:hypothetical protein